MGFSVSNGLLKGYFHEEWESDKQYKGSRCVWCVCMRCDMSVLSVCVCSCACVYACVCVWSTYRVFESRKYIENIYIYCKKY